jgi:hypothetical protein
MKGRKIEVVIGVLPLLNFAEAPVVEYHFSSFSGRDRQTGKVCGIGGHHA